MESIQNGKRFALSVIAAFAASFLFNWVFHGIILMPAYEATASVWRPMEEMQQLMPVCLMRQFLQATVMAWIFTRFFEARGTGDALRDGLYVGLLVGIVQLGLFVYLPIPFWLAGAWLAGDALLGILIALTISVIHNRKAGA